MKRALQVVGQDADAPPAEPEVLRVGETVVLVEDSGDGAASRRFAAWMRDAGARRAGDAKPDEALRIRIDVTAGARHDTDEAPDFVLGSARPAFARHLVARLERASGR